MELGISTRLPFPGYWLECSRFPKTKSLFTFMLHEWESEKGATSNYDDDQRWVRTMTVGVAGRGLTLQFSCNADFDVAIAIDWRKALCT
jgi:hypothetical protein